jgi:hypothetical protein
MTSPDHWLERFGRLGAQGAWHPSQWLGIPLTVAGLVGMLWSLPMPAALGESSALLNWATFFLMATVVYYFILSTSLAFGSMPFVIGIAVLCAWLDGRPIPLAFLSASTFLLALGWRIVVAWQTTGRLQPLRHLQHVMIGPLWLLAACYRRFAIPY